MLYKMFIILDTKFKRIYQEVYTNKCEAWYCIHRPYFLQYCITQELRAFSKFGVDVVVMRIPACKFLLCSIAKLPAKNFASSTLRNDVNYFNTSPEELVSCYVGLNPFLDVLRKPGFIWLRFHAFRLGMNNICPRKFSRLFGTLDANNSSVCYIRMGK